MRRQRVERGMARFVAAWAIAAAIVLLGGPTRSSAFEFFDGRLQVHGFFEAQVRAIAQDFSATDDWNLTQWYNILNVEIEADIAPNGWGPFDLISAYSRVEVRFDCIWTHACSLIQSVDQHFHGNRSGASSPQRFSRGRRAGFRSSGNIFNGDTRAFRSIPREKLPFSFSRLNLNGDPNAPAQFIDPPNFNTPRRANGRRRPSEFFTIQGIDTLYDNTGLDRIFGTADDPAPFYFSRQEADCLFNYRSVPGSQERVGNQILGPWNTKCRIRPIGDLSGKPDPLSDQDVSPILRDPATGAPQAPIINELPLRPKATNQATDFLGNPLGLRDRRVSQGVYFPNSALSRRVSDLDSFDQNFSRGELQWNRGASQQQTKELREAYVDMEFFDSRLWVRAGKQTIVWGKTELFRNQDQWNPQDLALTSLPALEESRIALAAVRGVWSFYDVGPFEDFRLEVAANIQDFEPTDLGRCGEPYAPNPVCSKTFGLFIHGVTGLALAGEERPKDAWNSAKGFEIGARLEWRWGRFSFAVTDFYGYTDLPYAETLFTYSRNVDPFTGRPRQNEAQGVCRTGREPSCLNPNAAAEFVVANHSVNQQVFRVICATSIGFSDLDPTACAQAVFNSQNQVAPGPGIPAVSAALSSILSGQPGAPLLATTNPTGGTNPAAGMTLFEALAEALAADVQLDIDAIADVKAAVVARRPSLASNPQFGNGDGCVTRIGTQCISPLVPLVNDSAGAVNGSPGDVEDRLNGTCILPTDPGCVNTGNVFIDLRFNPIRGLGSGQAVGLEGFLTDEQEALLGCGPFYGTRCDVDGVDLMNAEASALFQSFPGFEGTFGLDWDTTDASLVQPGTVGFNGGPVCTRFVNGTTVILPGCRGPGDPGYDPRVDGSVDGEDTTGGVNGSYQRFHPFTGQRWRSETAVLSWNALMGLVAFSGAGEDPNGNPNPVTIADFDPQEPFRRNGCSFVKVQFCSVVQAFFQVTGLQRNLVQAGGNFNFGRRDFTWHGGRNVVLEYQKRNILGFSSDFAEDVTKTNWNVEFTWQDNLEFNDNNEPDALTGSDTFNWTISVDRPTFINFLNANRTFFFNTQWFIQYISDYKRGFTTNGPWNVLAVFTAETGYFDDRLIPRSTFVYDFQSASSAVVTQITYRFSADFIATVGVALFGGRHQGRQMAVNPISLSNRVGRGAYTDYVENGLAPIRDRDEAFLRLRYTF